MSYVTFNSDKLVYPSRVIVSNVVVRASSDAVVNVCDGEDGTGPVVLPLAVKSGDTVSIAGSIAFNAGVYVDVVSGSVVGTVIFG